MAWTLVKNMVPFYLERALLIFLLLLNNMLYFINRIFGQVPPPRQHDPPIRLSGTLCLHPDDRLVDDPFAPGTMICEDCGALVSSSSA